MASLAEQDERSLVIRVTFGRTHFLMTGDIGVRTERRMLRSALRVRADVLKLGHHSRGSTCKEWIEAVNPRYAVATTGDSWLGGSRRVPPRLAARLKARGIRLLRTDHHGDVVFKTDGNALTVETYPKLRRP